MQDFADNIPFFHTEQSRTLRLFRNVVNGLFGESKRRLSVRRFHRSFNNLSRSTNELSIDTVARDDIVIGFIIRCGRRDLSKLGQIHDPACFFQTPFSVQLIGNGNEIDGLAIVKDLLHCPNDILVRFLIKIVFG